jgi:pimeloyl-ACP methyl ester carboxylesterase
MSYISASTEVIAPDTFVDLVERQSQAAVTTRRQILCPTGARCEQVSKFSVASNRMRKTLRNAETKLTMPMLVLTGEKASGEFLIEQAHLVDTNVNGVVIKGKCHWLMEEAPSQVIPQLVAFINKSQ